MYSLKNKSCILIYSWIFLWFANSILIYKWFILIKKLITTNLATTFRWELSVMRNFNEFMCISEKSEHITKSQDTTRGIKQFLKLECRQRNAKIRTWANTYEKTDLSTAWKHNTSNSIQNPENPWTLILIFTINLEFLHEEISQPDVNATECVPF